MLSTVRYLLGKSLKAYREGGLRLFGVRAVRFLRGHARETRERCHDGLLFHPLAPVSGIPGTDIGTRRKYLHPDAMPDNTDTVVEAGAYHGRDTAVFAKLARRVVAFEPSPRNYAIAQENLCAFSNVELHNRGLWHEEGKLEIAYGSKTPDDGFLEPDSGLDRRGDAVPVNRLDAYVDALEIEDVNFVKIEAEGAEPEVIEGMAGLDVDTIAVNIDTERHGESPRGRVVELLEASDYEIVGERLGHILFATRE